MKKPSNPKTGKKEHNHYRWALTAFVMAVALSGLLSLSSEAILENADLLLALLILALFIGLGILFDIIGVAVTAADPRPFHSMAAHKEKGAKEALKLLRNADRVSSVCNDVVGDICGIVSGTTAAVLVVRLISTKFLPTGQLLLAVGALLVLSGLHGWVQLPHREKTGGKIACGIVALVLAAAMLYGAVALGSVQHAITDVADKSVETDITCVIVNADDPAQSLDDVKGYRFGILEDRDTENTQSLLQQLQEKLGAAEHTAYASPALLTDALYDDQVGAILLNKGYIPLLEEQEGYADFSDRTRILYEYTTTKTVEPAPADTNAQVDVTKDPFVVYCSGIDARSSNINITSRSDVNILAVVNPTTRQILLVNTPRDYYLPLAHNGQLDKLTHAGIYGTGESMQTLDNLYGTHTSFYMRVNFAGLTRIVDALGGVDVYSTKAFSMGGYDFTEGVNHLNGEAALCFSRERYAFADGDNQRGKNQMAVIQAIISKASSPAVLKNYQTLLSSLSDAFLTSLSYDDIAALVQMQLKDMSGWHVTSYAVSGSGDTSYCYALGDAAWVMRPNMDTVNTAKELIRQVMSGETPQIP